MNTGFYGLWYKRPADSWVEALPLGNGRLGAMIYGGLQKETVSINEETCWEGAKIDRCNPVALQKLDEVRKSIFHGHYDEAGQICNEMMGIPMNLDCYQPVCSLDIQMENTGIFRNYRRDLNLETAIATVRYSRGEPRRILETGYSTREAFVSAPDGIFVMNFTSDHFKTSTKHSGLSMDISLSRFFPVEVSAEGNRLVLKGQCLPEGSGVRFAAIAEVRHDGGSLESDGGKLKVRQAQYVEIRLAAATNYAGGNEVSKCEALLDAASDKDYVTLKQRHIAEYQSLYQRQYFSLGGAPDAIPTDELILRAQNGSNYKDLYELWYNYLRYQLISSSRPGCQPSNLQGIWNDNMFASWNSDYHPNINLQINYWPVEGYGLPECFDPVVDWLDKIAEDGQNTAKKHYNARGWVLHHISDIFHCTTPMDGPWGVWPLGGAWMCRHLYEHYLFTLDKEWLLERALPLIRGSVEFMLDFLVECPKGIAGEGYLVTCPSHSPENWFRTDDGQVTCLTYAATMDMQIIRELFNEYLETLEVLGLDEPLAADVVKARDRLVPTRISKKTGGIMEWVDDYTENEPGHRHVSHLFGLYPGHEICDSSAEIIKAAENSLERRLSHNYDANGWSCGMIANMFSRLHKGNRSLDMLNMIVRDRTLPNLMVDAHGKPQVGDAQGVAAAIQEALAQSYSEVIELLPALPDEWSEGTIKGLRLRGGHIIDMKWQDSKLQCAKLIAGFDGTIKIKTSLNKATSDDGEMCMASQGILTFEAKKGCVYTLN